MQNKPFISVVIPCYNRADLIAATIKSLQEQDYPNYEILVIDDGSTDNTEDVVRSVATERTVYVKKTNNERAAARNVGASMAKGDYVNFFDSDDLALTNHLSEAAEMINKYNQPEWFHLSYAWGDHEGKIFRNVNTFTGTTLNGIMANGNPLGCNGVFVRKDIAQMHPFNEDRELSASEDYELWLRLAALYPLYYSNKVTSILIDHDGRSVRTINGQKLIRRLELFIYYLEQNKEVLNYYKNDFKNIRMEAHSYIALHLANNPAFKITSIRYLLKAFQDTPAMIKRKRFYATLKNILIKW